MTNVRLCGPGRHEYVTRGNRSKCSRCGSVQIDLTGSGQVVAVDPTKVFGVRRPTLFSLKPAEQEVDSGFGKVRYRR